MSSSTTVLSGPVAEAQKEYIILDSTYNGRIEYLVLTSTHLEGLWRLYIDEENARRDSDIIEALRDSDDLYETYNHYAQQDARPELIDVRDSTATWLVPCQEQNLDNVLTVARIMVALDPRWSIVGIRRAHPFDVIVQGSLTETEMASLQQNVFPSALSRLGNPTRQFLEGTVTQTEEATQETTPSKSETVNNNVQNNNIEAPTTNLPFRPRRLPSPPTETHSSNPPTWQHQQTAAANMLLPARRPPNYRPAADPPLPSYEAAVEAIHIENDRDNVAPGSIYDPDGSDDDEDILPSYRQASRRLARESRLLSTDPSEVEDPAGSGNVGVEDEDDEDGEDFVVPPSYQRGEDVPGYIESAGNGAGELHEHRPEIGSPGLLPAYQESTHFHPRPQAPTLHPNPDPSSTNFGGLDGTFDVPPPTPSIPTATPHPLTSSLTFHLDSPGTYDVPPSPPISPLSSSPQSPIFEPTLPAHMRTHSFDNRYNRAAATRTGTMAANADEMESWVEVSPRRMDDGGSEEAGFMVVGKGGVGSDGNGE